MNQPLNPYQPPTATSVDEPTTLAEGFSFRLTRQNLRYGQSHHLIRCRPIQVTLVSIAMIAVSLVIFSYCVYLLGPEFVLVALPIWMGISALAYTAVTRQPKEATEQRMADCGLVEGALVMVHADDEVVTAQVDGETVIWPRNNIKKYRTPAGIMIVPEQYVFLFLPSRGQFSRETYQSIVNSI